MYSIMELLPKSLDHFFVMCSTTLNLKTTCSNHSEDESLCLHFAITHTVFERQIKNIEFKSY